jgi:hypothetical protein
MKPMRRFLMFAVLASISFSVYALTGTTKDGYVACLSEEWLGDMVKFVSAGDKKSFEAYVAARKCIVPRAGLKVTVTESPGLLGTQTAYVYQGIKFWAVREAIEYGR